MAHSKAMGLGAMFVLLVVAIIVLPMIVRYIDRMEPHYVSGFQNYMSPIDMGDSTDRGVEYVPAIGSSSKLPTWRPDPNTDYLCRSPNEDGTPCDEGYFCDGTTQSCVTIFAGGDPKKELPGYYS